MEAGSDFILSAVASSLLQSVIARCYSLHLNILSRNIKGKWWYYFSFWFFDAKCYPCRRKTPLLGNFERCSFWNYLETIFLFPSVVILLSSLMAVNGEDSPTSTSINLSPSTPSFAPSIFNGTNSPVLSTSDSPSVVPTPETMYARGFYRQSFISFPNAPLFFNDTEQEIISDIFEGYTEFLLPDSTIDQIQTLCSIDLQSGSMNSLGQNLNNMDYRCQYSSNTFNVEGLPTSFLGFVNADLNRLTMDLFFQNLNVNASLPAEIRIIQSPAPSISPQPSALPTFRPTSSSPPTLAPSSEPTESLPTTPPNFLRPTMIPSPMVVHGSSGLSVGGIAAIVIVAGLLCLAGLYLYYQSARKHQQEMRRPRPHRTNSASSNLATAGRSFRNTFRPSARPVDPLRPPVGMHGDVGLGGGPNFLVSPTEDSVLSNKSMLSMGDSVMAEGSGDDLDDDGTKNLQDEFDQYKDQNLELLRTDVEGNLSGFEGYMSAAVTNALMGDDEKKNYEMQELLWGCDPNPEGTEIEASALFEVTDWLNRNESAGIERKGAFMQEILNKMVTSVRFGVIVAEDASRTIHESAAILGLQLAEDLPMTTVIISGMRKTTRAGDIIHALSEFGDIDVAAVASGKRGFGIVRFRRRFSVDQALQRYRAGEIVILDVSIQMKVLMPNGVLESR
jgi:hypothetical protein